MAKRIGSSLQGISGTRWSDRVESVKPLVARLSGVKLALEDLLELNITTKTKNEIHGALCYVSFPTCIIMSVVWRRTLVPIDFCNKVIQGGDVTLDREVANIKSLLAQLMILRDSRKAIQNEGKLVASNLQIEVKLFRHRNTTARKRTRFQYENTSDENVNKMNDVTGKTKSARNFIYTLIR